VKHEWYQTPTHVILTIFAKKVEQDKISVDHIAGDEVIVSITLPGSGSEEYQLHLDLFAAVEAPEMSILPMKVELKMKKVAAQNWADLQKVMNVAPAAYPTSNRAKKDWSAIEKDAQAEMDAEKPQGDEALNKLFKDIYGNASEETRRAMIKSFQTSGGTVLSTNWDDVSKADYEGKDRPSAPEGQQWADERK
jgi:suppressor of G2 allele of SKP1